MVVSDDRDASAWGAEILRRGGNAVDAAVATAFYLAVSRPHFASLGGGGFLVFCPKPGRTGAVPACATIDYREKAPAAATRDMFVRDGKAVSRLSRDGALASGVPGVVAGLLLAQERYGRMKRAPVLARPIEAARKGVRISSHGEWAADDRWDAMNGEARRIFGCRVGGNGPDALEVRPCPVGTRLRQPELARVLVEVSRRGAPGFYRGWVAEKIAAAMRAAGGILTARDLGDYRAVVRAPLTGRIGDAEVVTMPPPSAGGAVLLQLLHYAERAQAAGAFARGFGSVDAIHATAHAMALGFADRAQHFGDPDFVRVPLGRLLDAKYLDARWERTWDADREHLPEGAGDPGTEGQNTTHFSVIDAQGNAVAVTTTINDNFGSGFAVPGTGIVMNDEMDDFSAQPGAPNLFGLVGAEANAIAPGKRPLSSMTPTIVRDLDGWPRLVLGAQGGPRITTSVYWALLNRLRFGMPIQDAVIAPRAHMQWKPAELMVEREGFGAEVLDGLRRRGWVLKEVANSGKMHALERFPNGRVWGVADPRAEGDVVAE
jgi:gamma-glutamyltranspeptidase/glutathione hydrolase